MKEKFNLLISVLVLVSMLAACTPATTETPATEVPATTEAPVKEMCMTVEELDAKIAQYAGGYERHTFTTTTPETPVRIAYLAYENNPFWQMQKVGMTNAIAEAEAANIPLVVDFNVVSEDLDPAKMVAAIENAIVQEYDGIYLFPVNEALLDAEQAAVDAGVAVGHIAVNYEGSPALISIGQDLYNAGKAAGYLMIKENGGFGKVGIITGQFGVTAHELRMNGFKEALAECPGMEIVGEFEAHDSSDESYAHAQNLMSANPDLTGIYLTAGGPFGAARAVEEANKVDEVFVIGFDVTEQVIPYVQNGSMITIHQHETWQNHDVIVFLYNYIVDGTLPTDSQLFTTAEVVTAENVDEFWPVR